MDVFTHSLLVRMMQRLMFLLSSKKIVFLQIPAIVKAVSATILRMNNTDESS